MACDRTYAVLMGSGEQHGVIGQQTVVCSDFRSLPDAEFVKGK